MKGGIASIRLDERSSSCSDARAPTCHSATCNRHNAPCSTHYATCNTHIQCNVQQTRCGIRLKQFYVKQSATALPRLFANCRDLILREFDRFDVWHRPDLGHRRQLVAVPATEYSPYAQRRPPRAAAHTARTDLPLNLLQRRKPGKGRAAAHLRFSAL